MIDLNGVPAEFAHQLEKTGIRVDQVHFQNLIHEAFHFYAQKPPLWPVRYEGVLFEARQDIREKCYALNPPVANLLAVELMHLRQAHQHLSLKNEAWRGELKHFLKTRDLRYSLLSGTTVAGGLSCSDAEEQLEMVEGAPSYADFVASSQSGVFSLKDLQTLDDFLLQRTVPGDFGHYYVLGRLQLLVLAIANSGIEPVLNRLSNDPQNSIRIELNRILVSPQQAKFRDQSAPDCVHSSRLPRKERADQSIVCLR
ncbi:MAG: hypothetical protein NDI61_02615 [Bdellovibrionaceae bacterium]|nr:hypothetical protein [Pseudobdellovibrionaceae bacterium]